MPYIPKADRQRAMVEPATVGELNYAVTMLCQGFMDRNGGMNYTNINNATGAMTCASLELYRRLAAPYEDKKVVENGDVYFPDFLQGRSLGDAVKRLAHVGASETIKGAGDEALEAEIADAGADEKTSAGLPASGHYSNVVTAMRDGTSIRSGSPGGGIYVDGTFTAKTEGAFKIRRIKIGEASKWLTLGESGTRWDKLTFTAKFGEVAMKMRDWYYPHPEMPVVQFELEAVTMLTGKDSYRSPQKIDFLVGPGSLTDCRIEASPVNIDKIVETRLDVPGITQAVYQYAVPSAEFRVRTDGAYKVSTIWLDGHKVSIGGHITVEARLFEVRVLFKDWVLTGFGGRIPKVEVMLQSAHLSTGEVLSSGAPKSSQPQRDAKIIADSLRRGRTVNQALEDSIIRDPYYGKTAEDCKLRFPNHAVHLSKPATFVCGHADSAHGSEFPMAPQQKVRVP